MATTRLLVGIALLVSLPHQFAWPTIAVALLCVQYGPRLVTLVPGNVPALRPDAGPWAAMAVPRHPEDPRLRGERLGRVNFWDALTPPERDALMSLGEPRTFSSGVALFQEGEHADHVVVIRSGWTKICSHKGERERVIAERGPGQLVGERAALQVNVRSATVIALGTVEALVLLTSEFADFITAHPHVLAIVEDQVYDRLNQDSGQDRDHDQQVGHRRARTGTGLNIEPYRQAVPLDGQNCTIVMTDIVGFGATDRMADDRFLIQTAAQDMTRDAFQRAGIVWDECQVGDRGDGLLIVVPPEIPTGIVVAALDRLDIALKSYNRRATTVVEIRLRTAVDVGPVTTNGSTLAGEAIIHVARLLEAPALKRAMSEPGARLGVIASAFVYDGVIKHLDIDGYRQVRCKVKESRLIAWMRITGSTSPR